MNQPENSLSTSHFAKSWPQSIPRQIYSSAALWLAYLAGALFLVGIFAPSFTMIPKFGGGFFERLVRLFVSSDLEPHQFSLIGGILHLFQERQLLIGGLILLFSVVFPVAKLAAIILIIHSGRPADRNLKILESLGKWSMLDVFVIASLVICFEGFPGGTHIQVQWGIYVFAISILLTMFATNVLKRNLNSSRTIFGSALP